MVVTVPAVEMEMTRCEDGWRRMRNSGSGTWLGWSSAGPPAQELSDKLFRIASLLFSSHTIIAIIILLLKTLPLCLYILLNIKY